MRNKLLCIAVCHCYVRLSVLTNDNNVLEVLSGNGNVRFPFLMGILDVGNVNGNNVCPSS